MPFFGPLYNEMIVDQVAKVSRECCSILLLLQGVLPGLVRATAVNDSFPENAGIISGRSLACLVLLVFFGVRRHRLVGLVDKKSCRISGY